MTKQVALSISRRGFSRGLAILGTIALVGLGVGSGAPRPAVAAGPGDPAIFVREFSVQAIGVLADHGLSAAHREQAFRELLIDGFDVKAISRFVLGRYWRKATEAERAEFTGLFEDLIVATGEKGGAQLELGVGAAAQRLGQPAPDRRRLLVQAVRHRAIAAIGPGGAGEPGCDGPKSQSDRQYQPRPGAAPRAPEMFFETPCVAPHPVTLALPQGPPVTQNPQRPPKGPRGASCKPTACCRLSARFPN